MPRHVRQKRKPVRKPIRKPRGGKIRPSEVLGGISAAAAGASALGITAPFSLPIAGLTGLASGILRLFGKGGITAAQTRALRRAEAQGLVIARKPVRRRLPARKRR